MINVVVAKKRNFNITSNTTGGVINTITPVNLKNTPILYSGNTTIETIEATSLTQLNDVILPNSIANNMTLVFSSASNAFIVEDRSNNMILDGGIF